MHTSDPARYLVDMAQRDDRPYVARSPWQRERPRCLVVACSDGRLQAAVDEFLFDVLRVEHYDRLYLPGGPGALVSSGVELMRPTMCRQELAFLVESHGIDYILMLFHGPAPDGPDEAICADYRRKFHSGTAAEIRARQDRDALEIVEKVLDIHRPVHIEVQRCEIGGDGTIAFVPLARSAG